ncbi:uncharacterized protein LOC122059952 [Macadamia integrifolia]|uniref:uncharacterized protein LOC122059952 n=1 Tax=Macadamia integrifolia TaxID=60698 RepID=UPI001C527CAA|nr:uncharacterized protein LOC122059952 [Macadamia integrifolia]
MSGNRVTKGHNHGSFKVELKLPCNCLGCSGNARDAASGFEGVKQVEYDVNSNKLTVMGKVEPIKLQVWVEKKMGRKVELISSLPTNDWQVREEEKMKRKLIEELISSLSIDDFRVREEEEMKRKLVEEFISSLTFDDLKKLAQLISPLPEDGSGNKMGQTLWTKLSYEAKMQLVAATSGFNNDGSKTTKFQQFELGLVTSAASTSQRTI